MNATAVILAAGAASRFGGPKQVAELDGSALVAHAARAALGADLNGVVVVTGAHAGDVSSALEALAVTLVHNRDWSTGIASSIRCGVSHVAAGASDQVVIMLADQPRVSSAHLRALLDLHMAESRRISATGYGGARGVPAVFHRSMFDALLGLRGDRGAARIIAGRDDVGVIECEEASLDIDTPEALRAMADRSAT